MYKIPKILWLTVSLVFRPDFVTFTVVRHSQERCGEHGGGSLAVFTLDT